MNTIPDPIIADLKEKASRILEAFNNGELTLIEALRKVASLDREITQRLANEYIANVEEVL